MNKEKGKTMNSTEQFRAFKGIFISKTLWFSKLTAMEKCLLAEIESLSKTDKGCFASNEYFASFFGTSEAYLKKTLGKLRKLKLIKTENFNGRFRRLVINKQVMEALPQRELGVGVAGRGSLQATPEVAFQASDSDVTPVNTNALNAPISKDISKDINITVGVTKNLPQEKESDNSSIKSNQNSEPPYVPPAPPAESTPDKGWSRVIAALWSKKCGGNIEGWQLKNMKSLVSQHGIDVVKKAFEAYLKETEPKYISISSFASKFGIWKDTVTKKPYWETPFRYTPH